MTTIRFERIGRNRNPPDLVVDIPWDNTDELWGAVYEHVRPHLISPHPDISLLEDGTVLIDFGRAGKGHVVEEDS